MEITTIGLDLAKSTFQVHGIDAKGKAIVRRSLRRADVLMFFSKLSRVWSALRPVQRHIIGRERSEALGTPFV